MAFDGRRALLSTLDANALHAGFGASSSSSAGPNSRSSKMAVGSGNGGNGAAAATHGGLYPATSASARHSMIPRQSVASARVTSGGAGYGSEYGAASGSQAGPARHSLAPQQQQQQQQHYHHHYGQQSVGRGDAMDIDAVGQHSTVASTPHRSIGPQAHLNARRGGAGMDGHSTRQSMSATGRMSTAPTPNPRKSISMGRVSLAPGRAGSKASAQPVDPRPIREDRSYLAHMEAEIQDFLADTGFVFPPKYSGEFHMPSYALVVGSFRHIYHECIDLKYTFIAEPRKEVEEILQLLSDIRYPLIMDLSKTKLSAPGSIHNWPPVCGMLHWMIALESSLDRPTTKYHGGPLERPVSAEDEDFCHYFPYLWRCYEQFWDSKDEYPEEQAKLEKIFEDKSSRAQRDLDSMRQDLGQQESLLSDLLDNDSPLEVEMKEKAVLESDVKKFIEYRDTVLLPRIQQYRNAIEKLKADSKANVEQIQRRTRERDALRTEVDAQDVSADDFESMSRERESLSKQLEEVLTRLHDKSSSNGHMEISLSNKQARVEDELKALSDQCRDVELLPLTLPDGRQMFDFEVVAGNTATMLPKGLDIKHDLKRRINERRDLLSRSFRDVAGSKLAHQRAYDELLEEVEGQRDDADQLEMRVRSIREQTEVAAAASKEEARIHAELEAQNSVALAQLDQAGRAALDQAESRLHTAGLQLNLVRERDTALRKELHDEYVIGLETVLSLKSVASEGLKALQETAEACAQDG